MPEDKAPIVFRYEKSKGLVFPGIPDRSLTQAEYDALSPSLRREVLHSGAYTRLTKAAEAEAKDAGKKGDK